MEEEDASFPPDLEKFGACRFQFSTRRNGPSGSMKLSTRRAPAGCSFPKKRGERFSTTMLHGIFTLFIPIAGVRRPFRPPQLFLPPLCSISSLVAPEDRKQGGTARGGTNQRRRISSSVERVAMIFVGGEGRS